MNIEKSLKRIIKDIGMKEVAQELGITQVRLKNNDLSGVDLTPLTKYLDAEGCVCSKCNSTEHRIVLSDDSRCLHLECAWCESLEFSNSFVCVHCGETKVVDIGSDYDSEALYINKICRDCIGDATEDAKLASAWTLDISYLESVLSKMSKQKQLLLAKYIHELTSKEDMKDIDEFIERQRDDKYGYTEEYIEIISEYLKIKRCIVK